MRRDRSGLAPRRRDRGQSISVNYTLSLIIVTVLISGLFIAMSGYLDAERERVTRSELSVIGNRLAADIATTDRLANVTTNGKAEVRTDVPSTIAGADYNYDVGSWSPGSGVPFYIVELTFKAPDTQVQRTIRVKTAHEVVNDTDINGGRFVVTYTSASGTLEVDHQ